MKEEQLDLSVGPLRGTPARGDVEAELLRHDGRLHNAVLYAMRKGTWQTADEVHRLVRLQVGRPVKWESLKATIRDLRKPKYGGHTVLTRRHVGRFEYWLALKK